jgi:hypothetical protein
MNAGYYGYDDDQPGCGASIAIAVFFFFIILALIGFGGYQYKYGKLGDESTDESKEGDDKESDKKCPVCPVCEACPVADKPKLKSLKFVKNGYGGNDVPEVFTKVFEEKSHGGYETSDGKYILNKAGDVWMMNGPMHDGALYTGGVCPLAAGTKADTWKACPIYSDSTSKHVTSPLITWNKWEWGKYAKASGTIKVVEV